MEKGVTKTIKSLNQCISCASIIRENKEIYREYKNKTILKESFYKNHKEEIDKYRMARKTIEKFTGTSAVKINEWEKEITKLEKEIEVLNKEKTKIQDEFKQVDHIKYAVKTVNDDYGIDLSIEIDKAIKRGEKPSVIAQLKKFKEQGAKYEQRKEKAKDYYRNEER